MSLFLLKPSFYHVFATLDCPHDFSANKIFQLDYSKLSNNEIELYAKQNEILNVTSPKQFVSLSPFNTPFPNSIHLQVVFFLPIGRSSTQTHTLTLP